MSEESKRVNVGDIIRSEHFACGHRQDRGRIWVGMVFDDNKRGPFYDPVRAESEYVVEDVHWIGSVTEDRIRVKAVRLNRDGSFDPDGERIAFYQYSDYTTPYIDTVIVVGRMRRIISFIPIG